MTDTLDSDLSFFFFSCSLRVFVEKGRNDVGWTAVGRKFPFFLFINAEPFGRTSFSIWFGSFRFRRILKNKNA